MTGWFKMKRGITSHPIFKGHPERLAIWVWLLDNAAWKDTPHDVRGKTVMVAKGSVSASERRIADECGVGYQVVRTFIKRLEKERMVNAEVVEGRKVLTLCNWDKYQASERPANAPANAEANATLTHDQRTKEEGNNSNYVGASDDAPATPSQILFGQGLKILKSGGVSEKQGRSMIGKWRKEHGDEAVITALSRCQATGALEPIPFIEGALRFSQKKAAEKPRNGEVRIRNGQRQIWTGFDGWVREHA